MYILSQFHYFLYALREPMSQSMNKFSLPVPFFLYRSVRVQFAHAASMECHASPATRVSQPLEGESGVEQMNQRRRRRISRLLNLAEANASFVEMGIVKQGIAISAPILKYEIIYLRKKIKGIDYLFFVFRNDKV